MMSQNAQEIENGGCYCELNDVWRLNDRLEMPAKLWYDTTRILFYSTQYDALADM